MIGRWKCPKCKSLDVEISLPAWHFESKELELTYVETDAEAQPLAWYCNDCGETDSGAPERVEE